MKLFPDIADLRQTVRERLHQILILVGASVLVTMLMSPALSLYRDVVVYRAGDVAKRTVTTSRDFLLADISGTEAKRRKAAATVLPVLRFDDAPARRPTAWFAEFYRALAGFAGAEGAGGKLEFSKDARTSIERQFRVDFVGDEWNVLANTDLHPRLTEVVSMTVEPLLVRGIVANRRVIANLMHDSGATVQRTSTRIEQVLNTPNEVYDLAEASRILDETLDVRKREYGRAFERVVKKLALVLLQPNVAYDAGETERRIATARASVEPIYFQIRRGEVVVRAGDIVSASQQQKLERLNELGRRAGALQTLLPSIVLTMFVLFLLYGFTRSAWIAFRPTTQDISAIALTVIGSVALLELFSILAQSVSLYAPDISPTVFVLAAPVAAGGVLLQIILGSAAFFLFAVSFAVLVGTFVDGSGQLLALILLGNIVGALSMKSCHKRSAFISAGIRVAMANVLIGSCFILIDAPLSITEVSLRILCLIVGGVVSGVLGSALAPIAEYFGSYITDAKLLELSSLDHPLLRELSVQAPGTWNHSMVMGQMAEVASEAIGANALLARVGAYYHDIGKTKKPEYFVENQTTKENRHDKLTPSMSALIIQAHVKDGIEMAKQHRLPRAIVDFIPQHHGTALIEYFFDKAKKEAEEGEVVEDTRYRYPGPKPQTKEAGILMLADGVEAASRTISDPTPAKIQGLVQKIINKVFVSGQLEECELTLKDLHQIAKSFSRVLSGIHHRRVEYSEPAEKRARVSEPTESPDGTLRLPVQPRSDEEGRKHERRSANQESGGGRSREAAAGKDEKHDTGEALKRLGMR